jgi:hypothetical protein
MVADFPQNYLYMCDRKIPGLGINPDHRSVIFLAGGKETNRGKKRNER